MNQTIGCILLAAGQSRRFGGDKRHARLTSGTTLLEASIERYRCGFDELILVLRPNESGPKSPQVFVIQAKDAALGMGHSLAAGAREARIRSWSGVFVALADMPFVSATTLATLKQTLQDRLETAQPTAIVQPVFRASDGSDQPGHPVGFSADLLPEFEALQGDSGAREVVRRHAHRRVVVHVADPGVLLDVDRPDQLPRPP